jgi:hypothetical protein
MFRQKTAGEIAKQELRFLNPLGQEMTKLFPEGQAS